MCDERLWTDRVRSALPGAVDGDLTQDSTIDEMAARVLGEVSGSLIPIGFSMGGIVALAMARTSPDRIAAMALLDTNPTADLTERSAVRPRQQDDVRAGQLERVVVTELKPNYLAVANRSNGPLLELLRDMAMRLGEDVFVRQSEALRTRPDQSQVLDTVEAPVLIACGAEDQLCPPAWHDEMARRAPRSTLHVVKGAGHMLPLEQPEQLSEILAAWRANN